MLHCAKESGSYVRQVESHQPHLLPMSRDEIPSCKCGCGEPVYWLKKRRRWSVYAPGHYHGNAAYKDRDWLLEHYWERRMTTWEIAELVGVTKGTILDAMRRAEVPRRTRSESRLGRHAGAKNPSWRGGVTPERQRLYKSQQWKALIKACYARDSYRCQRCGCGKTRRDGFHAHHVKSWADHPELRMDVTNLVTLCGPCHLWVHSKANVLRDFLI